jgi:hypothetical protein
MEKPSAPRITPQPGKKRPRRWRKWLWLAGAVLSLILFLGVIVAGITFTAYQRTPVVIEWSFDHLFPALRIEVEEGRWDGPWNLTLRGVRIFDRQSGAKIAVLPALHLRYAPQEILQQRLQRLVLEHPVFFLSPEFLEALRAIGPPGGTAAAPGEGGGWSVGELQVDFGELYVERLTDPPLFVSARFTLDLRELGTTPELLDRVHEVTVWAATLSARADYTEAIAVLDLVRGEFTTRGLLREREIDRMNVRGGAIRFGREVQPFLQARATAPGSSDTEEKVDAPAEAMRLRQLAINEVRVALTNEVPGFGPGFEFTLNTALRDLPLGRLPDTLSRETQRIELAHIEVLSPIDPLVRVVSLHSVFVYFTLQGLLESSIQRVILLSPTLYVSRDLFLYMESMRGSNPENGDSAEEAVASPWIIEQLRIEFGRLVLGGERIGQVGLPFSFQADASDIRFADLAALRLTTTLNVRPQSFEFPTLRLELERLRGDLRFSYPPQDSPDNLVNELYLDGVRWRQFTASNLWLSATFDQTGVFASLGGEAYGGYLNAGLSFFFGDHSRWIGWTTITDLDLQQLTDVLAPESFRLTGRASLQVEVDAAGSKIERVRGSLDAPEGGQMKVAHLDRFLEELPPTWGLLRRSATTIGLETLRDFSFEKAEGRFWFVEEQGRLTLRLPGQNGSRNFELFVHADETADGRWKLGEPVEQAANNE